MKIAVIPARLGSQRLPKKNLAKIGNKTLVEICIEKCIESQAFDEIWLNTESEEISTLAAKYDEVKVHLREGELANSVATHQEFLSAFADEVPDATSIFQVHTICPLLGAGKVSAFVNDFLNSDANAGTSCEHINLECMYNGTPVNFKDNSKQNSQNIGPVSRITWGISGWKKNNNSFDFSATPTFDFPISRVEGTTVKTLEDMEVCRRLYGMKITVEENVKIREHSVQDEVENIGIDFDGVIHRCSKGFYDGTVYDDPIEGSLEALKKISEKYTIIMFSAKAKPDRPLINGKTGTELIWGWLEKHGVAQYVAEVTSEKPRAICYIDDKAYRFHDWESMLDKLELS